jgi:acetyl-CoA carboxylase biotin carboxyl carrier protein
MTPDEIRRIAEWLAATDIGLLELRGPAGTLTLRHDGAEVVVAEADDPAPTDETLTVTAPSVGVFLHRHPLRSGDFAPPGSAVAAGQPIGLLQVGPLLLAVMAPAAAQVLELLVPHGTAVGFGTPLAALLPDTPG